MEGVQTENRRPLAASFTIDYLLSDQGTGPRGDPETNNQPDAGGREDAHQADPSAVPEAPDLPDKPNQSYIALISTAILSSPEKKLLLSDIYQWIMDHYPYFKNKEKSWRNSVRHNLSLNDCFVKAGRSDNGKGHFWAIHPANVEDFAKGDYHRRRARRRIRRMAMNCSSCHPYAFYGLGCCPPARYCLGCLPYAPLGLTAGQPPLGLPAFPPLFLPSAPAAWPRFFLPGAGTAKSPAEKRHSWAGAWRRSYQPMATVLAPNHL